MKIRLKRKEITNVYFILLLKWLSIVYEIISQMFQIKVVHIIDKIFLSVFP